MPFLENVLRGKNVPRERMLEVAEHYHQFGGVSPINAQNRAPDRGARSADCASRPAPADLLGQSQLASAAGRHAARRWPATASAAALAFFTSAFSSYSGCRQYREDIERGPAAGRRRPRRRSTSCACSSTIPASSSRWSSACRRRSTSFRPTGATRRRLVFTAHSIPPAMADDCRYEQQLRESCRLVAEALGRARLAAGLSKPQRSARRSRGSSPTWATICASCTRRADRATWCWSRSASSPTTSKCSTTSTPRPAASARAGAEHGRGPRPSASIRNSSP